MNRISAIYLLLFLCGCNVFGSQKEPKATRLKISTGAEVTKQTVIPVAPESAPRRDSTSILTAWLQSKQDSLQLRKLVVAIRASAPLSTILADASLVYANKTYPLDRVVNRHDSTGFLVFRLSQDEGAFVDLQPQSLEVIAQFRASAHKTTIQASINSEARRRTVAVQADSSALKPKQKAGSAQGQMYSLRRAGAYIELQNISATNLNPRIHYQVDMRITAYAADISVPLMAYRADSLVSANKSAGFYYAIKDSSSQSRANGHVETTMLEFATADASPEASLNAIRVRKGQERILTMSVGYRPTTRRSQPCLELAELKYRVNERYTHAVTIADTSVCAR